MTTKNYEGEGIMRRSIATFGVSLTVLSIALAATPALAQAENSAAGEADTGLTEIVVTANKRSENLQNVPIAINAISGDSLAARGIVETSDLAAQVPNLQISSSFGKTQPNFILRGVSVGNEFNSNQASPIGVYLDEDYLSARFAQGMNLFDLERVEVVKGPQGTLYGRNTVGGAINIITRKAEFGATNGFASAGYGRFNHFTGAAGFGTTLVDDMLAIRIAGTYEKGDGELPNGLPGKPAGRSTDSYALRGSILFAPAQNLSFSIRGYTGRSNPTSESAFAVGVLPGGANGVTGYARPAGFDFYRTDANYVGHFKTSGNGVSLTTKLGIGSFDVTAITSYDDGKLRIDQDPDGSPVDEFAINWYSNYKQFNQDLRISSDAKKPVRFILGAYYGYDQNRTFNTYRFFNFLQNIPGLPAFDPPNIFVAPPYPGLIGGVPGVFSGFNVFHNFTQNRRSRAIYGEANWDITDKLTLTGGLRYTWDSISLNNVSSTAANYAGTPIFTLIPFPAGPGAPGTSCPGVAGCPANLASDSSKLTGRVILDYKPTDNVLLYASYSLGYRAGAINGTAYATPAQLTFVNPEEITAYETGFKTTLLDRRIRFNGAFFYYDYKNQQLQEVIGIVPFLRNAPKARAYGLDLDLSARITDAVTLNLGYGYLNSKYQTLTLSGVNLAGNKFSNAPDMTFNVDADITLFERDSGALHLRPSALYTGDTFFSPFGAKPSSAAGAVGTNAGLSQASYWIANMRVGWEGERFSIGAYVKNMFEKQYLSAGVDLRSAIGADFLIRGQRRSYGVDVSYRF
jgi:iron complex outermembrane recepter protein